jgi:Uma2 family endonuclease
VTARAHKANYTFREYIAHEAASNVKHEFFDGQIDGMDGGTPSHAALAAAVTGQLYAQLRAGDCRAFSSDLRVRVASTGLATYPDVTVVCGTREVDADDANTVTNPTLLVEVLSPSTEEYDRGEKLDHYRRIPTLRYVVLVSSDERRVETWSRSDGDVWTSETSREVEVVDLDAIGARLSVREIYDAAGV